MHSSGREGSLTGAELADLGANEPGDDRYELEEHSD